MAKSIATTNNRIKKTIFLSIIGGIFAGFDFMVFGLLSPLLAKIFFPHATQIIALLAILATFAAGFIPRIFGGMIFGYIGDKSGRKNAFVYTLLIMGTSTFFIGLLPSYAVIGAFAPALLITLRLLQGISFGGEYTGSMVFLGEHAPKNMIGFCSSFTSTGPLIGTLIGSVVSYLISLLNPVSMLAWGWRIPFIIGGIGILWGSKYRATLDETPIFIKQRASKRLTKPQDLCKHKKTALQIMGLSAPMAALSYLSIIYMPTYLSTFANVPLSLALNFNVFSILFLIVSIPIFGYLSDKHSNKVLMAAATTSLLILSYPAYKLISTGIIIEVICGQLILILTYAAFAGVLPRILIRMVSSAHRCEMISTFYNVTIAVFGGTGPFFVTYLINSFKNNLMPAYYLFIVAAISYFFVLSLKTSQQKYFL